MTSDPLQTTPSLGVRHAANGHVASSGTAGLACAQSRRLRLRRLGYEDIPRLSCLFEQTRTHPLLMASPTRFIDVAAIVACVNRLYSRGLGAWWAEALDGKFIGLFSLIPADESADVEIHVRLSPEAWGRWYAIEGTHLLCKQAFDALGFPRLFGYCHPHNQRVRQIMMRFGFRDLGLRDHRHQSAHCYELEAATWRERRRLDT